MSSEIDDWTNPEVVRYLRLYIEQPETPFELIHRRIQGILNKKVPKNRVNRYIEHLRMEIQHYGQPMSPVDFSHLLLDREDEKGDTAQCSQKPTPRPTIQLKGKKSRTSSSRGNSLRASDYKQRRRRSKKGKQAPKSKKSSSDATESLPSAVSAAEDGGSRAGEQSEATPCESQEVVGSTADESHEVVGSTADQAGEPHTISVTVPGLVEYEQTSANHEPPLGPEFDAIASSIAQMIAENDELFQRASSSEQVQPVETSKTEALCHPEATFVPEATFHPEASYHLEASFHSEATFYPEATFHPEVTSHPKADTHPEITFRPEATAQVEQTKHWESENDSEVSSTTSLSGVRLLRKEVLSVHRAIIEGKFSKDPENGEKSLQERLEYINQIHENLETHAKQLPNSTPMTSQMERFSRFLHDGQIDPHISDLYEKTLEASTWMDTSSQLVQMYAEFLRPLVGNRRRSIMTERPISISNYTADTSPQAIFEQTLATVLKDSTNKKLGLMGRYLEKSTMSSIVEFKFGQWVDKQYVCLLKMMMIVNNGMPEYVQMIAPHEDWPYLEGTDNEVDTHKESRYEVYRKMSVQANIHLMQTIMPCIDIRNAPTLTYILNLFSKFSGVFDVKCRVCKKIMKDYLPPLMFDLRNPKNAIHESCR